MRSESSFFQVPKLFAAYAPQYREEHYHLHGRKIQNLESLQSIFKDDHYEFLKLVKKVMKGALIGFVQGIVLRQILLRGPKRFQLDRLWLLKGGDPSYHSLRGYTAFGATMGLTWWVIKDAICMPHGQETYARYLIAHALMGGVLFATIANPVNFIHGAVAGVIYGGFFEQLSQPNYPRNFQLKILSTDEQKRNKLKRQDEQYEMSKRNVLSLKGNFYPL